MLRYFILKASVVREVIREARFSHTQNAVLVHSETDELTKSMCLPK